MPPGYRPVRGSCGRNPAVTRKSAAKTVDQKRAIKILQNPRQGAEQDHAKAKELIHVLRNVSDFSTDCEDRAAIQAELDQLEIPLWKRAVELVERHADRIVGLGSNLATRVERAGEKVTLDASYLESLPGLKLIIVTSPYDD